MKTKTKFQPKRLLKLADLLTADAKRKKGVKFSLGTWGEVKDPDDVMSCGTEACAFGLAAMSGAFKRVGLDYKLGGIRRYGNENSYQEINILWKGRDIPPMHAAQYLFGLTHEESCELFGGGDGNANTGGRGAAAERAVAKRIKTLVKAVQKLKKDQPRELALEALTR